MMANQWLEIEAPSLAGARKKARERAPGGQMVLSEEVLCDGKRQTAQGVAETMEAALSQARASVPEEANIVEEKQRTQSATRAVEAEAFDEAAAQEAIARKIGKHARVESLSLKAPGRKGFLGIGKTPSIWQARVFQSAVAEVVFRRKARIRVEIGEMPSTGYCQSCGRTNASADRSEDGIHFFCGAACKERYFSSGLTSTLFGPGTLFLNQTGGDISGMVAQGRAAAASARAYCWSCGTSMSMSAEQCPACGKDDRVKLA